jgi:2-haloacid dehalogenase
MLDEVKALTFDVFGTVVDWRSGITREGEALGRAKGLSVDWETFADAWRGRYQPTLSRVRDGELPWTKLDDLHRMSLEGLLPEFGIEGLSEAEIDGFNRAWHRLDPWPDAVEGLGRLKRRFILATLSNGNVALLVNMAKRAGLPWDCVLSAEVFKAYKPDPRTYLGVAAVFDVAPQQVMLAAAHHDDLAGARACGLHTGYIERPLELGAGLPKDVSPQPGNTLHVRDICALADALGC